MNHLRTLCIIALASAALAIEDVDVVDSSRIDMYSSMCASERHGNLLADPFDCAQFIQCDYGKASVKKCSGGLKYDTKLQVCNWEHLVECGTSNPGIPPHDGPVRCFGYDTLHFIADTTSCEKYYICANGIPYPHQCAAGIRWDYLNNQCDYPEKVRCAGKGDNNAPENSTSTEVAVTVPEPVEEIPDCTAGKQFYGCQDSCEEYFVCIGEIAYRMKCPQGYFWNDGEDKCDLPELARCNRPHV